MAVLVVDLTTDIGKIRFLAGDTDPAPDGIKADGHNFTDQEITTLRVMEGNHNHRTAAALLEIASRSWSRRATRYKLGEESEERNTAALMASEARKLRRIHGNTPNQGRPTQNPGGTAYVYSIPAVGADTVQNEGGPG
jgi:hypothetical protein